MNALKLFGVALLALSLGLFSCQKEEFTPAQVVEDVGEEEVELRATTPLESVLSIDYDKEHNQYYVVGVAGGEIDVWYGQYKNWTKLQENRDIDNRYSPSEFVDFSLGAEPGLSMFGVAVGNKDGNGASINAREFSDKPYFGDGKPEVFGN